MGRSRAAVIFVGLALAHGCGGQSRVVEGDAGAGNDGPEPGMGGVAIGATGGVGVGGSVSGRSGAGGVPMGGAFATGGVAAGGVPAGAGGVPAGAGGVAGDCMPLNAGRPSLGGAGFYGGGPPRACMDSDVPPPTEGPLGISVAQPNPYERGTTTGSNGSFEDYCDDNGQLVEHSCEARCTGSGDGGGGGIGCDAELTGNVETLIDDCFGLPCVEGRCPHWCPNFYEWLWVTAADGANVEIRGPAEAEYRCSATTDPDRCANPTLVGRAFDLDARTCVAGRLTLSTRFGDTCSPILCDYECTYESSGP